MLRKVLKYDLGAIWKIWLILSATSVALGAVGGVCMRLVENPELNFAFFPIVILGLILSFIGIIAYIVITSILIIVRYYNNFFTDEAYLTFTLPVKRSTLFDAKILTAFIFNTASALVFTVSLCLMLLIWPGADGSPMLFYLVITGFIGAFKAYSDAVALFGTNLNAAEMNTIVGYVYDMLYGDGGGFPSYASAAAIILFAIVLTITCINLLISKKHTHY